MRSIASPPVRKNRVIRAAWNIEPNRRRAQTRDILLGKVFPRRAQIIDTAGLRVLLYGT